MTDNHSSLFTKKDRPIVVALVLLFLQAALCGSGATWALFIAVGAQVSLFSSVLFFLFIFIVPAVLLGGLVSGLLKKQHWAWVGVMALAIASEISLIPYYLFLWTLLFNPRTDLFAVFWLLCLLLLSLIPSLPTVAAALLWPLRKEFQKTRTWNNWYWIPCVLMSPLVVVVSLFLGYLMLVLIWPSVFGLNT